MSNKKARSFVAIMIVISIIALLLRFAIEQVLRINISQNESTAQDTLKLISTAIENYAKDHKGIFPSDLSVLIRSSPAYIEKEYISLSYMKGYNYNCIRLETSGYTCSASPAKCNFSGRTTYTITTGGSLSSEECEKKQ
jgi:type II secretory pathway pseudopilin PulG